MKKPCPIVNVALASENNYFCGLLVTAASIAHFAKPNIVLDFTILDNGISDENFLLFERTLRSLHGQLSIHRVRLSKSEMAAFPDWHGNKAAYSRLMLPDILPENVRHIVYCDVDFLWLADISQLWDERRDDVPFISARDLNPFIKRVEHKWYKTIGLEVDMDRYFCSGLSFFNVAMFRDEGLSKRAIDFVLAHPDVGSADQTALNAVLAGRQKIVDQRWQRFSRDSPIETLAAPMALHYAGDVPWKISKRSHMLTDVQLLWFRFDASIRGITLWRSLRMHYSLLEIVLYRITFRIVMGVPVFRRAFNWLLAKTGRWPFYEKMERGQFRDLMKLLTL